MLAFCSSSQVIKLSMPRTGWSASIFTSPSPETPQPRPRVHAFLKGVPSLHNLKKSLGVVVPIHCSCFIPSPFLFLKGRLHQLLAPLRGDLYQQINLLRWHLLWEEASCLSSPWYAFHPLSSPYLGMRKVC